MNPSTATAASPITHNSGSKNPNGPGSALGPVQSATPTFNAKSPAGQYVKMGEIGRSGTFIYSGIITGEDYNLELTRFEGIRRYEIMRRSDSTIAAMLDAVKLPIEATNWHLEPASEEPDDVRASGFIEQELFKRNVKFHQLIQDANLMLDFGYSVLEKVLGYCKYQPKSDDGKTDGEAMTLIGLDKLAFRKHRSIYKWETTQDLENGIAGGLPGVTQYVPGGTYSIPMDKLVVFTFHKEGDNWEGISLLRRVYKDWDIKDKLILINAIRHERQGLGIIQVIAPEGASQEDIDETIANAMAARASEMGVFQQKEGWIVEFMDMKSGTGQLTDIIETIEYHDKQILLAVLAQFIMLGQKSKGGGGSRALSEDQSRLFELGLESVARTIQSTIQEQIIKPLCDMNFSHCKETGNYPQLKFDKIGDENVQIIGETVARLIQANGLTMDPELEQAMRTLLHLPDLPDDIRENYDQRVVNAGPMNLPDPEGQASQVENKNQNPTTGKKPAAKPAAKGATGKGATGKKNTAKLNATDDALELLRHTKEAALELLANEYAVTAD